jgi:hypothetical protein
LGGTARPRCDRPEERGDGREGKGATGQPVQGPRQRSRGEVDDAPWREAPASSTPARTCRVVAREGGSRPRDGGGSGPRVGPVERAADVAGGREGKGRLRRDDRRVGELARGPDGREVAARGGAEARRGGGDPMWQRADSAPAPMAAAPAPWAARRRRRLRAPVATRPLRLCASTPSVCGVDEQRRGGGCRPRRGTGRWDGVPPPGGKVEPPGGSGTEVGRRRPEVEEAGG